jgi:hypothetical protein
MKKKKELGHKHVFNFGASLITPMKSFRAAEA